MPGYTVLIIEDDAALREMLRQAVDRQYDFNEAASFECIFADRLSGACQTAKENGVDVILLDLHLPDGQGFESITKVQAECPDVPLVVWTGYYTPDSARRALSHLGVQDYFAKPPDFRNLPGRLIGAIARWEHIKTLKAEYEALRSQYAALQADLAHKEEIHAVRVNGLNAIIEEKTAEIVELCKDREPKTWLNANRTTIIVSIITGIVTLITTLLAKSL